MFIMKQNIHEENLFITCMPSWKVLAAVWCSYSVENHLAPASEEGNFTMDDTLGALKTHKTLSRDPFQEIFCKFQSTFKNLVSSSFLVALQSEYLR